MTLDPAITRLGAAIHAVGRPLVVVVTGGASRAISGLVSVPGASRTVLEARVPYSAAALIEWLGARPDHFCSEDTARAMAMRAFERARGLLAADGRPTDNAVGLACTASLASDRPKRGPHRAHLALQSAERTVALSVELVKGRRTRDAEESVTASLLLNLAAEAAGVGPRLDPGLDASEVVHRREAAPSAAHRPLVLGDIPLAGVNAPSAARERRAIFPGAFHPRHEGHREMARVAGQMLGAPVEHEVSIANVDKPPLDYLEIAARARQFAPDEPLWLTRAPTFVEKARLLPNATFIVGADTIERIGDPRYYGGDPARRDAAVSELAALGARFLVFGRVAEGRFQTLPDLKLPSELRKLCQSVPETSFRLDISSTALRQAADHVEGTP